MHQYTADIEHLGVTTATSTKGIIGVYIRYNPDILPANAGFFRLRPLGEEIFQSIEVTDFSKYDMETTEQLDWYTLPIKNGKPTWIQPFYDKNIDGYMISYVVPLYKDGEELGIIGMDIDYTYLTQLVDEITLYDTGHAFLTNDKHEVIHSKQFETGVKELPANLEIAYKTLENGMYLGVAVPIGEVMKDMNYMIQDILLASIFAIALAVFVIDLNGLKQINDEYGHLCGNEIIIKISKMITDVFGYAMGNEKEAYEDIFKRADKQMYDYKKKMKERGENTRVLAENN